MVRGLTRELPRLGLVGSVDAEAVVVRNWASVRGTVVWEGAADLIGGFPGFAACGGRLGGTRVRLTDRYLLVDEGRANGFGLPLAWLADAALVVAAPADRAASKGDAAIHLRYEDGLAMRRFVLRPRQGPRDAPDSRRGEQVMAALAAVGVAQRAEASTEPSLTVDWAAAAAFERENVVWSGRASAPVGGGLERDGCDVWLTTRSLIWGTGGGDGVDRLPLDEVLDVLSARDSGRVSPPAVFVGTADGSGGRRELPFVFDLLSPGERNRRERGAFLVGLRARGVPAARAGFLPQPWREEAAPSLAATGPALAATGPDADATDGADVPTADDPRGEVPDAGTSDEPAAVEAPVLAAAGEGPRPAMVAAVGGRAEAGVSPSPPASSSASEGESPAERVLPLAAPETAIPLASSVADDLWDWPSPPAAAVPPPVPRGRVLALVAAGAAALVGSARSPEGSRTATVESAARSRLGVVPRWRGMGREPGQADDASRGVGAGARPGIDIDPGVARSPEGSAAADGLGVARLVADGGRRSREPRATDGADTWTGAEGAASSDPALPRVRAYEVAALRQLMDVLRGVDDPAAPATMAALPPREARVAALAELKAAWADGTITGAQVATRRARLAAVGEAGPRLRSLAELRDAGYLTDDDLRRKRAAITGELARLLGEPG